MDSLEWNTFLDLCDEFIFEFEIQEFGKIYQIFRSISGIFKGLVNQASGIVGKEVIVKKETVGFSFKALSYKMKLWIKDLCYNLFKLSSLYFLFSKVKNESDDFSFDVELEILLKKFKISSLLTKSLESFEFSSFENTYV